MGELQLCSGGAVAPLQLRTTGRAYLGRALVRANDFVASCWADLAISPPIWPSNSFQFRLKYPPAAPQNGSRGEAGEKFGLERTFGSPKQAKRSENRAEEKVSGQLWATGS